MTTAARTLSLAQWLTATLARHRRELAWLDPEALRNPARLMRLATIGARHEAKLSADEVLAELLGDAAPRCEACGKPILRGRARRFCGRKCQHNNLMARRRKAGDLLGHHRDRVQPLTDRTTGTTSGNKRKSWSAETGLMTWTPDTSTESEDGLLAGVDAARTLEALAEGRVPKHLQAAARNLTAGQGRTRGRR